MTPAEVLGYAAGTLDEPRRTQLEREIVADLSFAETLRRFAARLVRILDDGQASARLIELPGDCRNDPSDRREGGCAGADGIEPETG
jgi:anti-sigma-K factor RskA